MLSIAVAPRVHERLRIVTTETCFCSPIDAREKLEELHPGVGSAVCERAVFVHLAVTGTVASLGRVHERVER